MRLLLSSNSKLQGRGYLEFVIPHMKKFTQNIQYLFIPYAGVTLSYDEYEEKVRKPFEDSGNSIKSIHHYDDPIKAVKEAQGIVVGGGSTWTLLDLLYKKGILKMIQKRVRDENIPYIGWSAGSNMACPTIKTTNDMPIMEPKSFDALHLIPFQINPHYPLRELENHFGETRAERLNEFMVQNPEVTTAAIMEGLIFYVKNDQIELIGESDRKCLIFKQGQKIKEMSVGDDYSFLLK